VGGLKIVNSLYVYCIIYIIFIYKNILSDVIFVFNIYIYIYMNYLVCSRVLLYYHKNNVVFFYKIFFFLKVSDY
jgi:hypothetical protein